MGEIEPGDDEYPDYTLIIDDGQGPTKHPVDGPHTDFCTFAAPTTRCRVTVSHNPTIPGRPNLTITIRRLD